MEEFSLLKDFALIMVVAGIVTLLLRKLHQPPVLGYLLAGLLVSPYFVPFYSITDIHTIGLLADIGMVLLLFGIGLEFGWSKIRQIGIVVLVIGGIEIATMISLGYGLGRLLGWSKTDALFLGAALHTSSSAIIVKILKDMGKLNLISSKVIVGILVVEDFAAVIIIALLSGINAPGIANIGNIPSLILKLVFFIAASLTLGAIIIPRIIRFTHRFNSRETLLIVSLGICFAMALISKELGLSVAAGAFLVGALIGDTEHSEDIIEVMSPVRDMFAALFFVAIGMLIDISKFRDFLIPAIIVAVVFIIGKILSNTIAAIISGYTARDSLKVGTGMPQMGEFSLAIAKVGVDQGITIAPLYPVIAISTTLTTVISPYLIRSSDAVADFLSSRSPRLLREYITHINDWGQTIRNLFPRRSEEAQKIQKNVRAILINSLILIVIAGIGTYALQYIELLAQHFPTRRDIIALLLGSIVLVLCLPSIFLIWRNLRCVLDEVTIQVVNHSTMAKVWRKDVIQKVLRDSVLIILSILILLWLIPLLSQLLFIGSLAMVIPALLLAFILYLVMRSARRVQHQLERTFNQVFLGEDRNATHEDMNFPSTHRPFLRRLLNRMKLSAKNKYSYRSTVYVNLKKTKQSDQDTNETDSDKS